MPDLVEQGPWPYANKLVRVRGDLSVEQAARRIDVSRQTWHLWEQGREPKQDNLKAIVEAFKCPPEMIGYTAPEGWELVPVKWIRDEFKAIRDDLEILKTRGTL